MSLRGKITNRLTRSEQFTFFNPDWKMWEQVLNCEVNELLRSKKTLIPKHHLERAGSIQIAGATPSLEGKPASYRTIAFLFLKVDAFASKHV